MSKIQHWKIDRLIPYEKNAKKHPKEQVRMVASSMQEFGFDVAKAIEVDKDGIIINGHGRRLAAIEAGLDTVPVRVRDDLTDAQVRAYRIADNKAAESSYDTGLLTEELRDLHAGGEFDMSAYFSERELNFSLDDLGELDLGALATDLSEQVEQAQSKTENRLAQEDQETYPITSVFPFKTVTADQKRTLTLLMSLAEGETNLAGVDALVAFTDGLMKKVA